MVTVVISGGFDPIHKGHTRLIKEAAKLGKVIVLLNSDEWLIRKKGQYFMDWEERAEILYNTKGVWGVIKAKDDDGTVCENLKEIRPTYFVNGGDRTNKNTPELDLCEELGIAPLFDIGAGGKIQSSSDLLKRYVEKSK